MKITKVTATHLNMTARHATKDVRGGLEREDTTCFVMVETDEGITGYGQTGITQTDIVAACVNNTLATIVTGQNPLDHEHLGHLMYWAASPWGQTGYASHAIAAIDVALWDIKGKATGLPVWRLLGGARQRLQIYITFGAEKLDLEDTKAVAQDIVAKGYARLKMRVGRPGLARRTERPAMDDIVSADLKRIAAVRDAIGPDVALALDAGNRLDYPNAVRLAREAEPYNIAFFEEPITQNDPALMAQMRRLSRVPLACGQNEGLPFRFKQLLVADAIDYAQPNVAICSGVTGALKVAGMAAAFNVPISNGGGHAPHNAHLQAGAINGSMIECHVGGFGAYDHMYEGLPTIKDGYLELTDAPGFGLVPDLERIKHAAKG
jgi:L-alanine-DL-glutamate epimerase-like enolase superfamily enzyme